MTWLLRSVIMIGNPMKRRIRIAQGCAVTEHPIWQKICVALWKIDAFHCIPLLVRSDSVSGTGFASLPQKPTNDASGVR